ncbi:hypothetical protein B0I35DRAFT_253498 [Stachybotrys elegans]|uniref:C2H2-type domain-containing protein n=1 Tax=Stachybotrys elegans TaxID=80388 RepID=A0A8K0SJT2_9HYPO|nr:hypothetical protein B0I35DRAFT_253498 [Stachybotrys elegans]
MEGVTSFTSRRPAAGALPAFNLPPPSSDIPRAGDGISPSISSVNTGSSQSSQTPVSMQYTYSGHMNNSWASPAGPPYHVPSTAHSSHQMTYGARPAVYTPSNGISYDSQRSSHSPGTAGDNLPAPPFDQVHQPFSSSVSSAGGHGSSTSLSSASQPPTLHSTSSHLDSYTHSRTPNSTSSYYHPQTHQSGFSSYTTSSPSSQALPASSGPGSRGLGSLASHAPSLAPPGSYRSYGHQYPPLTSMGSSVISSMHQPNGHLSMLPGMSVPPGYAASHALSPYGGQPPPAQPERPFKCEQCVQAFSRNHDLKRHKRIHLSVKPFTCQVCGKSFSRKDALKVRLFLSLRGHSSSVCCWA